MEYCFGVLPLSRVKLFSRRIIEVVFAVFHFFLTKNQVFLYSEY